MTIQALNIVASNIAESGSGAPTKIFCVLSSPWYVSQTRVIKMKKIAPFVFTSKLADELTKQEITVFEAEHLAKYANEGRPVRPIELKTIKTTLNGYETASPLNQKVNELEMTIFISMSGEDVLQKMEETIHKNFNFREIKFSSFHGFFHCGTGPVFRQRRFPFGGYRRGSDGYIDGEEKYPPRIHFFPAWAQFHDPGSGCDFNCSLHEASSCISLFKAGHATEDVNKKLDLVIGKLKEWLVKFRESLANLSNDISIPANIYLAVDDDFADFFSETIQTEQFSQYTLTESKFKIVFLSAKLLHGLATFTEDVTRDSFLIINSIYINRFLNKI